MAKQMLHPGARWLFRLNGIVRVFFLVVFLIAIFVNFALKGINFSIVYSMIFGIIILIVIIELYARLSYSNWAYEFTDTNLKIERGIIWKRYSNIPYERVQNVDIHRGVIARILGFSSVMIQTAGYSMPYGNAPGAMAEGYIPAVSVEEAEKIREFLMSKITRKSRQQGL